MHANSRHALALVPALIIILSASAVRLAAGQPTLQWVREYPQELGYGRHLVNVELDALGNVVFLGGSGLGNANGIVKRIDASGQEISSASFNIHVNPNFDGTGASDDGVSIRDSWLDANGGVYWAASTNGSYQNAQIAKVRKISSSGVVAWERSISSANKGEWLGIDGDGAGNLYLTGNTYGNLGGPNAGGTDAILQKYTSNGTLEWTRQFGSAAHEFTNQIDVDAGGNVLVAGYSQLGSQPWDVFIAKYDSQGNPLWGRQFGNPNARDEPWGIAGDSDGNAYLASKDNQSAPFVWDTTIRKYDSVGTLLWDHKLASVPSDGLAIFNVHDLEVDFAGNLYASTSMKKTLGEAADSQILKFAPSGELLWSFDFKGAAAGQLIVDDAGRIAVVGSTPSNDSWVALLHQQPVPEPSTPLAMLVGMTAAIFARRRQVIRPTKSNRPFGDGLIGPRSFERLEERTVLSAEFGSALTLGSVGTDVVMDIAVTAADERVSVGAFSGTVDFAPGTMHAGDVDILTVGGASDAFFAKYADDGSLLWARSVQGSAGSTSVVRSVAVDGAGNSYLAGDFSGTIAIGAFTLASGGDRDGFAAKVDANGNVLWAARWGAADKEYAYGVAVDAAGNLLAVGTTSKYSGSGSLVTTNMQIHKFNASGVAQWSKQIGNASGGNEIANAVATDASGNVFVTGSFKGKVDFDPSPKTKNVTGDASGSSYVLKLTSAGNFGWVSPFLGRTSASYSSGNDLAMDASGSIIVGGYYYGSVDFNPGTSVSMLPTFTFTGSGPFSSPGYLAKLNSSGAFVWVQKASGVGAVNNIVLDAAGSIYVTGDFYNSGDFDPGAGSKLLTSNGSSDVYVAKFSSTGTYQWAVSLGGASMDQAQGIAVDGDGDVHVAGSFRDAVDFNPDPLASDLRTSAGGADGFVLTLSQL